MKNEVEKLLNGRGIPKQEFLTLELNMNYICRDTIRKRKAIYGNNFPVIAEMESNYFGIIITPSMVAYSFAILKQVRINFIEDKLQKLEQNTIYGTTKTTEELKQLRNGLEDSLKDYSNYLWISQNYAEYEAL